MASGSRKAVIVIGSGQSARLVATRLRSAAEAGLSLTVLGPKAPAALPEWEAGLCHSLTQTADGVVARLADGRSIMADAAVLATGCASFGPGEGAFGSARQLPHDQGVHTASDVILLGTGSRAIRYALAAVESGHRGRFIFLGKCVPASTIHHPAALDLSPADIPLGTGLRFLLRWFRQTAGWAAARGISQRELLNGLRPHVPLIWRHLTATERRRFVVHLRPYWLRALDTITADERQQVSALFTQGRASFLRGRCLSLARNDHGFAISVRRLPTAEVETLSAGLVVNFEETPPGRAHLAGPVIAGLIDDGLARPDEIEYGLDVTDNCALVDARGRASERLFAVGAPTRGHFVDAMEIDCIQRQSERVARTIFGNGFNGKN